MRNTIAAVLYGFSHVIIWIIGVGVSIFELLWLIQFAIDGEWVALILLLMIGTPIILQVAFWVSAVLSMPFMFTALKLNPELGE